MAPSDRVRRARTAFLTVGAAAPAVLLLVAAAIIVAWLPRLPDPVAVHWSVGGPDRFAPPATLLLAPLVGLGVVALLLAAAWFVRRFPSNAALNDAIAGRLEGRRTPPRPYAEAAGVLRAVGALSLAAGTVIAADAVGAAAAQLPQAGAATAPGGAVWAAADLAVFAGSAAAGWFAQPRLKPRRRER